MRLQPKQVKKLVKEAEEAALKSRAAYDRFCEEHQNRVWFVIPSGVLVEHPYLKVVARLQQVHYDHGEVPSGLKAQGLEGYWQGETVLWHILQIANFEGEYRVAIWDIEK